MVFTCKDEDDKQYVYKYDKYIKIKFDWVGVLCIRAKDTGLSVILMQRGYLPITPPFWSCKP